MKRTLITAAVLLLALFIRMSAARYAYPTPGDATHFVQHGVAMAHLGMNYMSTYWSQGMIAAACLAVNAGLNPHDVLQLMALVSGIGVVLFVILITRQLSGGFAASIMAGLLAAVLPPLVLYSVIAYSEMIYMAFIFGAVYFVIRAVNGSPVHFIMAALLAALSFYFKGADAMVTCAGLALFLLIFHRPKLLAGWKYLLAAVAVAIIAVAPLFMITESRSGSTQPGSKLLNLAIGRDWADSKAVYAVEKPWQDRAEYLTAKGVVPFLFKYRGEISRRIVLNSIDYVKIINDLLFQKTFRMGSGWFVLFVALLLSVAKQKKIYASMALPLVCIITSGAVMSLFFFHERLLVPVLPFYIVSLVLIIQSGWNDIRERYSKVLLSLTCAGVILFYGIHASGMDAGRTPWWSYYNSMEVARKLRHFGGEDLKIMASHAGVISVYHYKVNPLVAQPIPFAELTEVENEAARQRVDLIIISDQYMTHWPIHSVFDDRTTLPAGWRVLEDFTIKSDDWRVPDDRWLFIGRGDYADQRAAAGATDPAK